MFHIKNKIVTSLALVVLLTTTVAFARNESTNPLTGKIGVDVGDESSESIRLRSGPGDPVAGKDKSQLCQGCHGEEGVSTEGLIPKLAGQYGKYISKELRNYQAGTRSHQIMNAMAATISDDPCERPGVPARRTPAIVRERPLEVEIEQPMVEVRLGGNALFGLGLFQQSPGAKDIPGFQQEVPVPRRPVVFQNREPRHGGSPRGTMVGVRRAADRDRPV